MPVQSRTGPPLSPGHLVRPSLPPARAVDGGDAPPTDLGPPLEGSPCALDGGVSGMICAGWCVDHQTDHENCGGCGGACGQYLACGFGECRRIRGAECSSGDDCASGSCYCSSYSGNQCTKRVCS